MTKRNLIIIHRGPEYRRDFNEICEKIRAIDTEIAAYAIGSHVPLQAPQDIWSHPTLTVAITSNFRLKIRRGPVLRSESINKLVQARIFREAGLPTPPIQRFHFGMRLDPILFGEFVVIKPMSFQLGSQGRGVQLFRRRTLEAMKLSDFPAEHLIHKDRVGYLVQRFIDAGPMVPYNRVLTLFSEPMYSYMSRAKEPRGSLESPDEIVQKLPITNNSTSFRDRMLHHEDDALDLARRVHYAFPNIPLLGTDIIREEKTGRLYVIECNAGGNVWHFSSKTNVPLRRLLGRASLVGPKKAEEVARQMHIDQFGAFDRAAEVLVRKTRELAA